MIKPLSYNKLLLKRRVEDIFIYPFILVGRSIAFFMPLKEEYQIFLFFPFYHTGGAEKFNVALANALAEKKAIIFFTRKSVNNTFLEEFKRSGHKIVDIHLRTDNKWIHFVNL